MSSISRIASVIEGVLPLTARQVRDASDDLISHELIRPGRRGHGAESRDAREGALILLSSFGASSARGAGRLAKRLTGLSWKHGVRVDLHKLSERAETASAVAALENAIGKRDFLDTQTELLNKFRQIQAALGELQAAANTMKDTAGIGVWHSYFTVELHVGERVIAEIRTGLERVPTEAEISFDMQPLRLFELMGVFADDTPITDPHLTPETRRFDMKAIAALGAVLAS